MLPSELILYIFQYLPPKLVVSLAKLPGLHMLFYRDNSGIFWDKYLKMHITYNSWSEEKKYNSPKIESIVDEVTTTQKIYGTINSVIDLPVIKFFYNFYINKSDFREIIDYINKQNNLSKLENYLRVMEDYKILLLQNPLLNSSLFKTTVLVIHDPIILIHIKFMFNLSEFTAMKCNIRSISSLYKFNSFKNLAYLDLSHNDITKISGLDPLINLKTLKLGYNQISKINGLNNLIHLENLHLNNNKIRKIQGFVFLINLIFLDLSFNQIRKLKNLNLANGLVRKLTRLILSNNKITKIKNLENIELDELILKENKIKINLYVIQHLSLTNIISLSIDFIHEKYFKPLFKYNPKLKNVFIKLIKFMSKNTDEFAITFLDVNNFTLIEQYNSRFHCEKTNDNPIEYKLHKLNGYNRLLTDEIDDKNY